MISEDQTTFDKYSKGYYDSINQIYYTQSFVNLNINTNAFSSDMPKMTVSSTPGLQFAITIPTIVKGIINNPDNAFILLTATTQQTTTPKKFVMG